jgi:ketosteroid isomerase-like protein
MTMLDSGRAMMSAYLDAIGAGAMGHFAEYFAEDVVLQVVGTDQEVQGRQAVEADIRYLQEQAFDGHPHVKSVLVDGDRAVLESDFVGRHIGEFAGKAPTGREVRVPCTIVYDLADNRITALRIYGFMDALLRQLEV